MSVDPNKDNLKTLPEILSEKGYLSGLVATSSITHATPAAFYAHIDSRYETIEIAKQLLSSPINIALGGGLEFFDLKEVDETHVLINKKNYFFLKILYFFLAFLFPCSFFITYFVFFKIEPFLSFSFSSKRDTASSMVNFSKSVSLAIETLVLPHFK